MMLLETSHEPNPLALEDSKLLAQDFSLETQPKLSSLTPGCQSRRHRGV